MPDLRTDAQKKEFDSEIRSGLEEAWDEHVEKGGDSDEGELEESGIHDPDRGSESESEEDPGESTGSSVDRSGEQEDGDEEHGEAEEGLEEIDEGEQPEADDSVKDDVDDHLDDDDDKEDLQEASSDSVEPGDIDPHVTWPAHVKEEFSGLPKKSQVFLMESFRGMQADYTRKMQAISGVQKALDPIKGKLAEAGVTTEQAIGELVQNFVNIESSPVEALRRLANIYKVSPEQIAGDGSAETTPAAVSPEITNRLDTIESAVVDNNARAVNQVAQSIDSGIKQLIDEGHMPFYDDVERDMLIIVDVMEAKGQEIPSVVDLYNSACASRPDVLQKMKNRGKTEETMRNVKDRKTKMAKSKNAARNIKTSATKSHKTNKSVSLRDELEFQYDRLSAAE